MHADRFYHETLHTVSFVGASVATWAAINAEHLQVALGVSMAVGSALWSFWLSMKAKAREEQRNQEMLDFRQRLQMAIAVKEAGVTIEESKA